MHEAPGVVHVEATHSEVIYVCPLGKHEDATRGGSLAQAVDAHVLNPKQHCLAHGGTHVGVVVVEVGHIGPVGARREYYGAG